MRTSFIAAGGALAALLAPSPCGVSPIHVALPDSVQGGAMSCAGEASQICPEVWTTPDHGLACMRGKRGRFSPRCRAVSNDVARALERR